MARKCDSQYDVVNNVLALATRLTRWLSVMWPVSVTPPTKVPPVLTSLLGCFVNRTGNKLVITNIDLVKD